jgi:ParB family chromosome partitioning protein
MAIKKGLGKGIDALISRREEKPDSGVIEADINEVEPNRSQPREDFNPQELDDLSESIKAVGIIQPIIVTKEEGFYKIVAGERRWRAARLAGLQSVPIIVRELDEQDTLALALIENLQRVDLNPLEEAVSYKRLMDEFGFTQEEIAKKIGKSRSAVANILRYLSLPERVKELLKSNAISQGHAKVLMGVEDEEKQELAEKAAAEGLSVRALEDLIKERKQRRAAKPEKKMSPLHTAVYNNLERELDKIFGTRIKIRAGNKGTKGRIEIAFYNAEDLDRLYLLLKNIK